MENSKSTATAILAFCLLFAGASELYGQHEQHSQPATTVAPKQATEEFEHIFCPTMKTGQVCSHGTAATLGLQGDGAEAWVALARKYNRAVNAATEQLFTDAEAVLSAEQLAQLKAWFAVGLNPQINELLYAKGMGRPMAPAIDGANKPADAAGEK
jgi:hypothetical protein